MSEYRKILSEFDSYEEYLENLNTSIDTNWWNEAKKNHSRSSYEHYLRFYPQGKYKDEAERIINEFIKNNIINKDNNAWEKAKEKNTIKSYKKYILDYHITFYDNSTHLNNRYDGVYIDEAEKRIDKLRNEKIANDKKTWKVCLSSNTKKDYENYLKFYPNGIYAGKAFQKLLEIEEEFWELTCQKGTRKDYENYLKFYPDGMYVVEAEFLANEITNLKYSKNRFFLFFDSHTMKYGLKDKNKNIIISGEYAPSIKIERYGIRVEKNKCGLYAFEGNMILEAKYDWIKPSYIGSLDEYRFIVKLNDKYGVMNNKGKIIIDILYEEIKIEVRDLDDTDNFYKKEKIIYIRNLNKSALYDINGNMILDFKYDFYAPPYHKYGNCLDIERNLYLNLTNKVILDLSFYEKVKYFKPSPFQEKGFFAQINENKKMGFIDENGKTLINDELDLWINGHNIYDNTYLDDESWTIKFIRKNGEYGIINEDLIYVLPPVYDAFYSGQQEIAYGEYESENSLDFHYIDIIKKNGKYGLFNYNTNIILDTEYDLIFKSEYDIRQYYILHKDGKDGICDSKGDIILDVQYKLYDGNYELIYNLKNKNISSLDNVLFMVEKNNKFGLFSIKLSMFILEPVYDKFDYYSNVSFGDTNTKIVIKIGNKKGLLNGSGYWLKPLSILNNFIKI